MDRFANTIHSTKDFQIVLESLLLPIICGEERRKPANNKAI